MDKGLTVLIVRPEIPKMPHKISAQAQKFLIFEKKLFLGVRDFTGLQEVYLKRFIHGPWLYYSSS
jgi:hypothetical protein